MFVRRCTSLHQCVILIVMFLVMSLPCHGQKTGQTRNFSRKVVNPRGEYKYNNFTESPQQHNETCFAKGIVKKAPKLRFLNREPLKMGQELTVECVYPKCHSSSRNVWYLDEHPLADVLDFEDVDNKSVVSVVSQAITADLDGNILVCRVWHSQSTEDFMEARQLLSVRHKPLDQPTKTFSNLKIGDYVDVWIALRSNPKPSSLVWFVGDKKIYYGTKGTKYVSQELSALDRNYWKASLRVANLTQGDLLKKYSLVARNTEGVAEYQFELKGADEPFTTDDESYNSITTDSSLLQQIEPTVEPEASDETTQQMPHIPTRKNFMKFKSKSVIDIRERTIKRRNDTTTKSQTVLFTSTEAQNESSTNDSEENKIAKIKIFKRPALAIALNSSTVTNVLMVTGAKNVNETNTGESNANKSTVMIHAKAVEEKTNGTVAASEFEPSSIEQVVASILSLRTSFVTILNILLAVLLIYYHRQVKALKAKVMTLTLATPGSHTISSYGNQRPSNAYTPTYFSDNPKLSSKADNNDYQLSSKSRSIYYTGTGVNASLHSYESIGENIYTEITHEPDLHLNIDDDDDDNDDDDEGTATQSDDNFDRCVETRMFSNEMVSTYI